MAGISEFLEDAGLPDPTSGGGFLEGLGAAVGGPAGALGGGLIGLVGQGISGWLQAKEREEEREAAEKRYNEQLAESAKRWEADQAWTEKRYNLDRSQYLNGLKNQREQMDNYYNERNYNRQQNWNSGLQKLLQTSGLRKKYLETWGR